MLDFSLVCKKRKEKKRKEKKERKRKKFFNFFDPPHYVTDFQWGIRLQGNGGGMRPKDILRAKLLEKVRNFSLLCPIVFLLLTDL